MIKSITTLLIILLFPLVGIGFEMKCERKFIKLYGGIIAVIRCENNEVVCYNFFNSGPQCKFK